MSTLPDETDSGGAPGTGSERVGDAQRTAVLDLVDRAYAEGFLDAGEHETRRVGVTGSKTVSELHAQVADLPARFRWDPARPAPANRPEPSPEAGRVPPSHGAMALMSLVLGVVSIPMFLCFGSGAVFGALAVIAGTRGVRDRAARKLAIAGIVLGAVGIVLGLGFVALLIFSPDQTTVRTR
jgi:hypothetical protein